MKSIAWRITVSTMGEVRGLEHEVMGALTNENGSVTDGSVIIRWRFVGTSRKQDDTLRFALSPGPWKKVEDVLDIPKYVQASITSLCRTMIAASKRKVQLPIDFFDPCGPKGQRDEAHCSPESE